AHPCAYGRRVVEPYGRRPIGARDRVTRCGPRSPSLSARARRRDALRGAPALVVGGWYLVWPRACLLGLRVALRPWSLWRQNRPSRGWGSVRRRAARGTLSSRARARGGR